MYLRTFISSLTGLAFVFGQLFILLPILSYSASSSTLKDVSPSQNDNIAKYGSELTTNGLVSIEYFYEEPGYGDTPESDTIVGACLLKLDTQNKLKNGTPLKTIHLIFTSENGIKCSDLVGKRVEISGTLEEIHTGHHHGDALLDVKTYKTLR